MSRPISTPAGPPVRPSSSRIPTATRSPRPSAGPSFRILAKPTSSPTAFRCSMSPATISCGLSCLHRRREHHRSVAVRNAQSADRQEFLEASSNATAPRSIGGVPTALAALLNVPVDADISSARYSISRVLRCCPAPSRCKVSRQMTGTKIHEILGMTETGGLVAIDPARGGARAGIGWLSDCLTPRSSSANSGTDGSSGRALRPARDRRHDDLRPERHAGLSAIRARTMSALARRLSR